VSYGGPDEAERLRGHYLPAEFLDAVVDNLMQQSQDTLDGLVQMVRDSQPPAPPLTRWQKLRNRFRWWRIARWDALHYLIFRCRGNDDC
jgi:hypothetical protein